MVVGELVPTSDDPWYFVAVFAFMALVFFAVALWTATQTVLMFWYQVGRHSWKLFHVSALIGCTLRGVAYVYSTYLLTDTRLFLLRRISLSMFLVCFSAVGYNWALFFHRQSMDLDRLNRILFAIFSVVNFILLVFQAVAVGLGLSDNASVTAKHASYDASVLAAAGMAALISIYFTVYGIATVFRKRQAVAIFGGDAMLRRGRVKLFRILLLALTMTVCFLSRVAMYMYRPITGTLLPEHTFQILAYLLPEAVPVCLNLIALHPQEPPLRSMRAPPLQPLHRLDSWQPLDVRRV